MLLTSSTVSGVNSSISSIRLRNSGDNRRSTSRLMRPRHPRVNRCEPANQPATACPRGWPGARRDSRLCALRDWAEFRRRKPSAIASNTPLVERSGLGRVVAHDGCRTPIAIASPHSAPVWLSSIRGSTPAVSAPPRPCPRPAHAAAPKPLSASMPRLPNSYRRCDLLPDKLDSSTQISSGQGFQ
jgi:hypothetical protein